MLVYVCGRGGYGCVPAFVCVGGCVCIYVCMLVYVGEGFVVCVPPMWVRVFVSLCVCNFVILGLLSNWTHGHTVFS